jgi:site-specific DNA-methyltransferase (adenine-specific)
MTKTTQEEVVNGAICGDSLEVMRGLKDESVDCVITSPPYWGLRDYGVDGQLGLEPHFNEYIFKLIAIFDEVKRVLKKEGTCWVNLGDTYSGNKEGKTDAKVSDYLKETTTRLHKKAVIQEKCLCQIPSRFAIAMTDKGWILRNRIIWQKPNAMPSSVEDRFTVDYEDIFFFVKSKKYNFDTQRIPHKEVSLKRIEKPWHGKLTKGHTLGGLKDGDMHKMCHPDGRNMRAVWSVNTASLKEAHFATFPEALIEPMVLAGCPKGGVVLDPFFGAGTTGVVAKKLGRNYLVIELNPEYIKIAQKRIDGVTSPLL